MERVRRTTELISKVRITLGEIEKEIGKDVSAISEPPPSSPRHEEGEFERVSCLVVKPNTQREKKGKQK